MEKELQALKRQGRFFKWYAIVCSTLLLFVMISSFSPDKNKNIIRARGIIIEDSLGRDRILIGSPAPFSEDRLRTDYDKVKEIWGAKLASKISPEKYMEAYKTYNHDVNGIIFLNEKGYDKVMLGDKMTDPNTGKRIGNTSGIGVNNAEGFERIGLGILEGKDNMERVIMGMDDPKTGAEAMHLFVMEDGTRAMRIAYDGGHILLGKANPGNLIFKNKDAFSGILIKDSTGKVLWEQNALEKK